MSKTKEIISSVPSTVWLYLIAVPLVTFVAYYGIIRPILKKSGVIDDKDDRKASKEQNIQNVASWWKRDTWKSNKNRVSIDNIQADFFAEQIYDSKGVFNDDEEAVSDVFKNLKSKADVSKIADRFTIIYNTDLHEYLKGFNEADTMNQYVYIYVNELR